MPPARIKPSKQFIDQGLQSGSTNYTLHLAMEISEEEFTYCVLDPEKNQFYAFEHYVFTETIGFEGIIDEVTQIIEQSPVINKWKGNASLAICHQHATIVPNPVFNPDKLADYIQLNFQLGDTDRILYNKLHNLRANNVFTFPSALHHLFTQRFVQLNLQHFSTALIDPLMLTYKHHANPAIQINVQKKAFQLLVFQDKSLRLYNSFNYQNEEDLIYFLLYSLEQLQLDHKEHELLISGNIAPNSTALNLLGNYFKKTHFQATEEHRAITEAIGVPAHFYLSLFKQHLCE